MQDAHSHSGFVTHRDFREHKEAVVVQVDDKLQALKDDVKDNYVKKESFVTVKNDVAWIKRFFWIVATSSIGSLVANLLTFMHR